MSKPTCPCCDSELKVYPTKTGKPFLICESCGYQVLIRKQPGIDKFTARYGDGWKQGKKVADPAPAAGEPKKPAAAESPAKTKNDADMF